MHASKGGKVYMKNKIKILVIFLGCLLLMSNIAVATSAFTLAKTSSTRPTEDNIDKSLIEEDTAIETNEEEKLIPPTEKEETNIDYEVKQEITPSLEEDITPVYSNEEESFELIEDKITIKQSSFQGQQQTLPLANAGGPYSGDTGTQISFSASTAVISPGTSYTWDFGDGNTGCGLETTHTYANPGRYIAVFTVTKSSGQTYIDITPIYIGIENDHLIPNGKCCYYATAGKPIVFDASLSTSTDPNLPIVSYKWYMGDGTICYGRKAIHTYEEPGAYFVQLEVTDSAGNTRRDVLHADIDCKLEKMEDFLDYSHDIMDAILLFIDEIKNQFLYSILNVKIVTEHNGNKKVTTVLNGNNLPQIDVNNDGTYDLKVEDISFFTFGQTYSDFTGRYSISWESSFSVNIFESGAIKDEDDFSISLQFTFGQYVAYLLNIEEPTVDIGYSSEAGQKKTNGFTITHQFRPYLLERFWLYMNSQNNNQNTPQPMPVGGETTTYEPLPFGTPTQNKNTGSDPLFAPMVTTPMTTDVTGDGEQIFVSKSTLILKARQYLQYTTDDADFYPEHEVGIRDIDAETETFSLYVSFTKNSNTQTKLELSFDNFVDSTVKSKRFYDVAFQGYDNGNEKTLTLTLSRKNNGRTASLGVIINPIQNFVSYVDHKKDSNGVYTLDWLINNPPENLVFFVKSEDSWGDYNSNYIYVEKIPESLTLELLPLLEDGYLSITRQGADEFKVGIKNDLNDPTVNFYLTHPHIECINIEWKLLSQPRSIKLETETEGLAIYAEIKDITQEHQRIFFEATVQESLDLEMEWSFMQGYFSVRKSQTSVDFTLEYLRDKVVSLIATGLFIGTAENGFTIDFNGFEGDGKIQIDTGRELLLHISAENLYTESFLLADLHFKREGHMLLEWDQEKTLLIDSSQELKLSNLNFNTQNFKFTADEISLAANSAFDLQLDKESQLNIGSRNNINLSNINVEIGYWSGSLEYARSMGTFNIEFIPGNKYLKVNSASTLDLGLFRMVFDDINTPNNNIDFGLDAFNTKSERIIWFDFSSNTPKLGIEGKNQLELDNLYLRIGPRNNPNIDFNIDSFAMNADGQIYSEFNAEYFYVSSDVDFDWNISIQTLNFGNWEIDGSLSGEGTMNITEWEPGQSGMITFSISKAIEHNLKIIHNHLTVELGNVNLNPGLTTIKWQREQDFSNGYFNITNDGVTGNLALCKITYADPTNPIEFEIGNISIQPGTLRIEWLTQVSNVKILEIINELTINLDLIKLRWADKTITIGSIGLNPGQFKTTFDTLNKRITLNNGMNAFGPLCTYEDADRKLSVDLVNLVNDYDKTMTLRWFEDTNDGKIIGVSLDTDGADLVDWITFESIKYDTDGATGRRISLGGLRADNFKIMKNANNHVDITGKIYIANHITFSRLVNIETDQWENLDIEWDLQSELKMIRFESEFDLTINLIDFEIGDIKFTANACLTDYMEVKWKLAEGPSAQKEFHFDTDGATLSSLNFRILGPDNKGIEIMGGGIWAENFYVKWQAWPPQQADLQVGGEIGYDTVTIYGTQNGSNWIEIWPFASGSQYTE
jgi:hypothetical protein